MKKPKLKKAGPSSRKATSGKARPKESPPKKHTASKRRGASPPRRATASPAKRKSSSARPRTTKGRKSNPPRPSPPPVITRKPTAEEIAHQHHMERFENALKLFNQNQVSRARAMFERLKSIPAAELAERAAVYVRICEQRLSRTNVQLKTAEDYYNYAVGLANEGNADESEEYLQKALKLSPKADFVLYALATTYALRDDVNGALEYLLKAIELDERNRFQAQNDADFTNLLEDPRFTELLYPEKPLP